MIADTASENENLEKKTSNTEYQLSFFLLQLLPAPFCSVFPFKKKKNPRSIFPSPVFFSLQASTGSTVYRSASLYSNHHHDNGHIPHHTSHACNFMEVGALQMNIFSSSMGWYEIPFCAIDKSNNNKHRNWFAKKRGVQNDKHILLYL